MKTKDFFVANSLLLGSFAEWKEIPMANCAVMIINARKPVIEILKTDGLNESEIDALVKQTLSEITIGCNYNYQIIKKIGNCYLCN